MNKAREKVRNIRHKKAALKEAYIKYCTQCIFSCRDYWAEERIMNYEEFKKSRIGEHKA